MIMLPELRQLNLLHAKFVFTFVCVRLVESMAQNDGDTTIQTLKEVVSKFVKEREWERFHTPRNIAESISIESAELLEIFQWSNGNESPIIHDDESRIRLEEELADVLTYCFSLANVTGIDVTNALLKKIKKNESKYPVEKYKGTYTKARIGVNEGAI
jgi:dCTP diphosphatase